VLVRAGHTEAGCALARLAGAAPAAVIVEILNEDGTMARRPDLEKFAAAHNLKIGTIADLIEYRVRNEKTVERINECLLPTEAGDFRVIAYQDVVDNEVHLALVKGVIREDEPVLVRVHVQNSLCDLLGASYEECGWPLKNAMKQIEHEGGGVVVILRNHDTARDIVQRIQACQLKGGADGAAAIDHGKIKDKELRTFGVGAQILIDLGVKKMRVMSAPKHLHALAGFHLEVTEFVDFDLPEEQE
jgi:3,4-dihydroxy 2-butanone 4-phosphate synthase/GTP cyclohydrolase II